MILLSLSIFFYLPSSQYEHSWVLPQTAKEVVKLRRVKHERFIAGTKKGVKFNHFQVNPKSTVHHEVFLFIVGLLRSVSTKLKSITSISKLQNYSG